MTKVALITGITGQDGSYLAELLLSKGYVVHGIIRRASTFNTSRIDHLYKDPHKKGVKLFLHHGDMNDSSNLNRILEKVKPDEIYNLAAQSHVQVSFEVPEYTAETDGIGVLRMLDAIKETEIKTKFYQASTSELYGKVQETPQSETTPFYPRSPYGAAKLYAYWIVKNYREAYNLHASNGILFNHESPRRGETFVTRKITRAIAAIVAKKQDVLYLGNLDSKRDWGFAPEYVESMWTILQQQKSDDFVIGTGETQTIRKFIEKTFKYVGLDSEKYVKIDKKYFRPTEVDILQADITKAKKQLNWKPKINLDDLAKIMIDADMRKQGLEIIGEGDEILKKKFPNKWWAGD